MLAMSKLAASRRQSQTAKVPPKPSVDLSAPAAVAISPSDNVPTKLRKPKAVVRIRAGIPSQRKGICFRHTSLYQSEDCHCGIQQHCFMSHATEDEAWRCHFYGISTVTIDL